MASEREYICEVDVAHLPSKTAAKLPAEGADNPLQPLMRFDDLTLAVVQRRPLTFMQSFQKSLFDWIVGLAILLPIFPLLFIVISVIRYGSPELLLFRQSWIELHGCRLEILKLRAARSKQSDLLADWQTKLSGPWMGRWLQKSRLDELPQLFNVINSEMSPVGQRPHALNRRASVKLLIMHRRNTSSGIKSGRELLIGRRSMVCTDSLKRSTSFARGSNSVSNTCSAGV